MERAHPHMAQLITRQCDGEEKGTLCKQIIEKAFHDFFACGIKSIEDACNTKRAFLLEGWQHNEQETPMQEYGLPISFKNGIEEIAPPFELTEPDTIELYILKGQKSSLNDGLAVMDIRSLNKEFTRWRFNAYLDVMGYSNSGLRWTGFEVSVEEIVYHELLHACGDVPWKGKRDGILRHNLIGIEEPSSISV